MANMQAMQESLLKAADIIVTQRINELELDKTITAIVKKNLGQKNGKPVYQVYYSGGTFDAICQSVDDVYLPNTSVYVLIPQGNFSNEKIIIGATKTIQNEMQKQIVASESNSYAKLSNNLLTSIKDNVYGLHSWHDNNNSNDTNTAHYYQYIYQKDSNNNDIDFNKNILDIYKNEATALMIQAEFQTNLDLLQRQQSNARYGLIFNFAFDNLNTSENSYKYEQFILTSDKMIGNAFLFNQWSNQYNIIQLNTKTLSYLDSIVFFQEGFIQDYNREQIWPPSNPNGPDILVKNIQLYPLKKIQEINDYSLKIEPYNNSNSIITENSTDPIQFKATFLRKFYEDLSSNVNTKFYWFKESFSNNSNTLAGIGWEELNNFNTNEIFSTTIEENTAYKNNYKCIAQYNDIILEYKFSIYNELNTPLLKLESDLGTKFSFDAGLPTISIKIKDIGDSTFIEKGFNEQYDLFPEYIYNWCIIDNNGNKIFLTDQEEDNKNINLISQLTESTILKNIKRQTRLSNNAIVEAKQSKYITRIICPVADINNNFSVMCYVQKRNLEKNTYFNIGSAKLDFINEISNVNINNYKIEIENDDQIFKYDIYGKAPTDESNKDPLKIKNLIAKLTTLNDIEIDSNNYQIEWIFPPKEQSLLISSESTNNNTICIFDIEKDYNPDSYNNQITCHISFDGLNLYKDTKFYFGKEGDNGTNGTDIVAKIEYNKDDDYYNVLEKEPVTLYIYDNNQSFINTDKQRILKSSQVIFKNTNDTGNIIPIFRTSLYQRSNKLKYSNSPIYSLAGNKQGKYFETGLNLIWKAEVYDDHKLPLIQNLKVEVKLNDNETYYAFVSLPIIKYLKNPETNEDLISIDKQYYLNEITYNNDGRNPIYNHNKGLKLNLPDNITLVEYSAKGGFDKDIGLNNNITYAEGTPCFSLLANKDSQTKRFTLTKIGLDKELVYVLPNDNYNGSITNNRIEARCYDKNNVLIAIVYAPIHMSLNTFGLASLNAWDGNSVTIDNEGGYVMAPQVGAGEKDSNNRFTGILMGKTETYTGKAEKEKQIGLFGYSCGLQSIFLDAETGNATFGLPDGYTIKTNNDISVPVQDEEDYGEGRIELRPGGESKIGGWKIGRRSLYYTMKPLPIFNTSDENVAEYWETTNGRYKYEYSGEIGPKYSHDEETPKKRDYAEHHRKDIKVHDSGILFSSDPPYMSIVGTMLTDDEIIGDSNAYLKRGDSVEIQLDPQTPTVFTIFRHNSEFRKQEAIKNGKILGDRTFLAGINSRGQLQANIIGTLDDNNNQASMYFGLTRRFNQAVDDTTEYIGAIFEAGKDLNVAPYMKLLINKSEFDNITDEESPTIDNVYLSVPGEFNIDFKNSIFNGNNNIDIHSENSSYYMEVNSLKDAIEGCLKAATDARAIAVDGGLRIYNGD